MGCNDQADQRLHPSGVAAADAEATSGEPELAPP